MPTRIPFELGAWYHCYNRGVEKRRTYSTKHDYERFLLSLYLGNNLKPVHISNLADTTLQTILRDTIIQDDERLVEIGAYCLMSNHFHLILREIREGGIALFMQKVMTGYTMYFNKKHERTGALFAGTFKSKHLSNEIYLKHAISYVHLNPAELFDTRWKGGGAHLQTIKKRLAEYPFSSLPAFLNRSLLERKIIGTSLFDLYDHMPSMSELVEDAHAYYAEYQG